MTALTVAGLTLREAIRRRVVWALLILTVVLLALSAWGFSKLIGLDTNLGTMTSGAAERSLAEGMRSILDSGERIRLISGLRALQGEQS